MPEPLSAQDYEQLGALGIPEAEAQRQLAVFTSPSPAPVLDRPCTIGDGIRRLSAQEADRLVANSQKPKSTGRFLKFVPASGAASRMFQALMAARERRFLLNRDAVASRAPADPDAQQVLELMDGWKQLACSDSLRALLFKSGQNADALALEGRFTDILEYLVGSIGLDYAALPKALLLFHSYPDGPRTALEEQLVEAAAYAADAQGRTRLHITVSPEHLDRVQDFLRGVVPVWERQLGARFEIKCSIQKGSTDTIAVGPDNLPFRTHDGRLLFRPGGHGALIENLHEIQGDIIFIKNIDNVVPDHLKSETVRWKQALAGLLVELQDQVFAFSERIEKSAEPDVLEEAGRFLKDVFGRMLSPRIVGTDQRAVLLDLLSRPIRVCGVVQNQGEPGGGPFWVRELSGSITPQIIEQAQVANSSEQKARFQASTHFNPVDVVCAVRDRHGKPFDLHRYVDPEAVFITEKTKDGKPLKAFERPGLWNGAMARWLTVFVEVPAATFNPVKTINDLLRAAHQPPKAADER